MNQIARKIVQLLIVIVMDINLNAQDPNFYIFLCFGQSNMAGAADAEAQDSLVNQRFKVLSSFDCPKLDRAKGSWYTATPPLCNCRSGLSPVDYFGRTMVDSLPENITIGVINIAVPGCKIELFEEDKYQEYLEEAPDWLLNMVKEYNNNPYGYLVEMAKIAQKDGVIKGVLLHQGESNPNDSLWTTKVKGIYDNLMLDLNLNSRDVPLLAGETVHKDQEGKCEAMNAIIATLPQKLRNSYVIPSNGCTCKPDKLHFTADGYRELGKRYAQQMLLLLK